MPREPIDDEVTVRRQGVQAALGPDGRAGTGDDLAHERRKSFPHHVIRCTTSVIARDGGSAAVLRGLDGRLAVGGEAVVGRLVHPDPHREDVGTELRRPGGSEVGDLLLGDGQRQVDAERGEQAGGPCVGSDHHASRADHTVGGDQVDAVGAGHDRLDAGVVMQRRAEFARTPCHRGSPRGRRHDSGAGLMDGDGPVRQRERRPPFADRVDIQHVVGDVVCVHRRRVVVHGDLRIGREQVEPAGDRHELLAGLVLEAGPLVVGAEGQGDVGRGVVTVPDDPRGVVRGAAVVSELECLDADHTAGPGWRRAKRSSCPAPRGR